MSPECSIPTLKAPAAPLEALGDDADALEDVPGVVLCEDEPQPDRLNAKPVPRARNERRERFIMVLFDSWQFADGANVGAWLAMPLTLGLS